jgi:hypothetical protein
MEKVNWLMEPEPLSLVIQVSTVSQQYNPRVGERDQDPTMFVSGPELEHSPDQLNSWPTITLSPSPSTAHYFLIPPSPRPVPVCPYSSPLHYINHLDPSSSTSQPDGLQPVLLHQSHDIMTGSCATPN